jgi:hypothetical protein
LGLFQQVVLQVHLRMLKSLSLQAAQVEEAILLVAAVQVVFFMLQDRLFWVENLRQ